MKPPLIKAADIDRTDTWQRYRKGLCDSCHASCCTLPVEVRLNDLIRLGLVDEFERAEPLRLIARRLQKSGEVERFNHGTEVFTLSRMANNDCLYLDPVSRRCTVYARRPDTCRNHPQVGPRPGFCPYRPAV
ncbi:MAG: Fe-S-oxidoreductase [Gammaproteobacteria bacterium HGW-Gammaproteobacteria-11]|nr:MAG: Fe-S-oxidoreductase [Gammaproteobacteria bacterium HGW-Gammaproteobacteria-11]